MELGVWLAEHGCLPDALIRAGIRAQLRNRLNSAEALAQSGEEDRFIASLQEGPVALETDRANEQHYEVPPAFFEQVLGPRMKYSCCLYPGGDDSLEEAETSMLELTCTRAEVADGMRILDLGCGWGSLSLWLAEHYPNAAITAVSNSRVQRRFIEDRCAKRGINNVKVLTADMNHFEAPEVYDRILSVEMFEHMRNYPELLSRIRRWMTRDGRLFVHIFCHASRTYPFESEARGNWMARNFFSGGIMPAYDLLPRFDRDLYVEESWKINGKHYYATCMQWLAHQDARAAAIRPVLDAAYGPKAGALCFQRWRMFFLACAELFRFNHGEEWFVAHYRFKPVD
jgi:cyclopropane-fatty-acyl-phospholipid synthase